MKHNNEKTGAVHVPQVRDAILRQLEDCWSGEWTCVQFDGDEVRFVRKSAAPIIRKEQRKRLQAREALRTCAVRLALQCSVDLLRRHWQYDCTWRNVQRCYRWLCAAVPTSTFAPNVLKGAHCELESKVQQLLSTYLGKGWITPNSENEVWLRLGVDGTLVWQTGVESITLSFAHIEVTDKPQLVHVIALAVGHESRDMLDDVFSSVQIKSTFVWNNNNFCSIQARLFVCCDHMARVRLRQCSGATARASELRMCPYCDLTPSEIRRADTPDTTQILQVDRRFGIPSMQNPPELLHLTLNVLKFLLRHMAKLVYPRHATASQRVATEWLHLASPTRACSDHSAAVCFIRKDGWRLLEHKLWRHLTHDRVGHSNMQLPRRALWLSCNILNSLFKMKLTSEETRRISRQCNWLRCILSNLRWSLSIWVHILVVHVPSYVEQWGSLRLFSTYAVEGSHRWLKKGFRLSMKSTTPRYGSRTGLQEILHTDTAKLELVRRFNCDTLLLGRGRFHIDEECISEDLLSLIV